MKLGAKRNTENIKNTIKLSRNFEESMTDAYKKSERRAWMVTWSAVTAAVLLAAGYLYMLPLKKEVPYLVLADPQTGTSSVARLNEDFSNSTITSSEALNKSNVAHFIVARESYDWDLIGRRDLPVVYSMAGSKVAAEYKELFTELNPNNPDKIWGSKFSVRIKIKSIVLLGSTGSDVPPTSATVRFERILIDNQGAKAKTLDNKIATMAFTYKSNLKMEEDIRVENPLGFQVISYRVDNDAESALPAIESINNAPVNAAPVAAPATGVVQ